MAQVRISRKGKPTCGHDRPIHCRGLCSPCYQAAAKLGARAINDSKCATCKLAEAAPGYVYCLPCNRANATHYRKANMTPWRINHRRAYLKARYGLTPEQWQEMWDVTGGNCELCFVQMSEGRHSGITAAVDHDHDNGKVRGLICSLCNVGMGSFRDDPDTLERAAAYLRRHAGLHEVQQSATGS